MQPMGSPVSFSSSAQVWPLAKNVRMTFRLSSMDWCGGQPARGPTSGSEAYLNNTFASASTQGRKRSLLVSMIVSLMVSVF